MQERVGTFALSRVGTFALSRWHLRTLALALSHFLTLAHSHFAPRRLRYDSGRSDAIWKRPWRDPQALPNTPNMVKNRDSLDRRVAPKPVASAIDPKSASSLTSGKLKSYSVDESCRVPFQWPRVLGNESRGARILGLQ